MSVPLPPADALVVFALIAATLIFFVTEALPTDITAIALLVTLFALGDYTGITTPTEALAGFSSPATITIVAMYVLSESVQETGVVQRLGAWMGRVTGGNERRMLGATVGVTGSAAGFVNNTPVVAVFIPMITGLADDANVSPSKLLMPLSFAAMLGGTLTLLGTSTNVLASDLAVELTDHGAIGMFEFTPIGILVFVVGATYLLFVAPRLLPARIKPGGTLMERFAVHEYLNRLRVRESSPFVGRHLDTLLESNGSDLQVVQLRRNEPDHPDADPEIFVPGRDDVVIQPEDRLTVRANLQVANRWATENDLAQRTREEVVDDDLHRPDEERQLVTVVVPEGSDFIGETPREARFREWHHTTVLGVRRGSELIRDSVDDIALQQGDALLVQAEEDALAFLQHAGDLVLTNSHGREYGSTRTTAPTALSPKAPLAIGIVAAVVVAAALGVPIVMAGLGGIVFTVATGCLRPSEAYDAVSWDIIFLLAGVIPLGRAMQATGGAQYLGDLVLVTSAFLPIVAVLGLFYVLTGLFANIITPVASVVLLVPVAVDTANRLGSDPFSFLLAVMFAASTAFMTPVGYQTNLMVYGPGGYTFGDYLRVGAPLQGILAIVTTLAIAGYWGI